MLSVPRQAVLHIRNLPEGVTERDLVAAFSAFGTVVTSMMMSSRNQVGAARGHPQLVVACVRWGRLRLVQRCNRCLMQ